jgi:hypothetical protein
VARAGLATGDKDLHLSGLPHISQFDQQPCRAEHNVLQDNVVAYQLSQ